MEKSGGTRSLQVNHQNSDAVKIRDPQEHVKHCNRDVVYLFI